MQSGRSLLTAGCLHLLAALGVAAALCVAATASERAGPQGAADVTKPAATTPAAKPQSAAKPLWHELTPAQQQALAPLAQDWDSLDATRKNKWLAIGNKFSRMKPDEQQRVQERMRDWVALTPEQRRLARESFARAKKLHPERKSAHWEQYQQLPDEQKRKLAADAAAKKPVAALPAASAQKKTTLPPIKSAPKPALERSVTPEAARSSAIAPSPQPSN